MEDLKCKTCAHYDRPTGQCKRFPPLPFGTKWAFPQTLPDEWCGEWLERVGTLAYNLKRNPK
jgi:hypothetical protein